MSLVIFDLDETMIHGDCSSLWSQRMASLGWVDESFVRRDAELMEQYAEGKLSMDLYMDYTLQPLIGRSVEEVEREVEAYVEEVIEPLIYSDACACLARHRSANDRVLIVSASGCTWSSRSRRGSASTKSSPSISKCSTDTTPAAPSAPSPIAKARYCVCSTCWKETIANWPTPGSTRIRATTCRC